MRFKLLHVRPHVWFLKHEQQTDNGKTTSDESFNDDGNGPAFKRSASMKLLKSSDRKLRPGTKSLQRPDARVCTVVDAGCTCRATVTSSQQHKQKKADLLTRPGGADAKMSVYAGDKYAVCRPRRAFYSTNTKSRGSDKSSLNMVSRMVCKTSDDVVQKHSESTECADKVPANQCNIKDYGKLKTPSVGDSNTMNIHALECKLRNAGLEDRRSSKKHCDGGPLISSGASMSSRSTETTTDITRNTIDTSELQEIVMSSNPEYDMVADDADFSYSSMDMSLEELRASIAQTKLANRRLLSKQARLISTRERGLDQSGMNSTSTCPSSPAPSNGSSLDGRLRRRASKPDIGDSLHDPAHGAEDGGDSVKHVDGGGIIRQYVREADLNGVSLQEPSQKFLTSSNLKTWYSDDNISSDESELSTAFAMRDMSGKDHGTQARIRNPMHRNAHNGGGSLNGSISAQGYSNCKPANEDEDAGRGGGGQDKRVVSCSSSCEIQVLSDYMGNLDSHTLSCSYGGPSSSSSSSSSQSPCKSPRKKKVVGILRSSEPEMGIKRSNSSGAVAMVKSSYDPHHDFKESMLEMVVAKQLQGPCQLQQLLQCYISLNPSHYHPTIIEVFHELCSELFT